MRYRCYKTTISLISDNILENLEQIKDVLNFVKTKEIMCSIKLYNCLEHEKCRVVSVEDKHFRWRFCKNNSFLDSKSLISDIECLSVIGDGGVLTSLNSVLSRWSLLDIDGKNLDR